MDTPSAPDELGRITRSEIASQAESWTKAAALASENPAGLPIDGERVLVLGCGTSYYLAAAYAWIREQGGHGVTDAVIASELPEVMRDYDRVLVFSRSGSSIEALQAVERIPVSIPTTGILGELDSPIGRVVTYIIDLSFADDRSVVQTRFPTTLLTLLRAHLGEPADRIDALIAGAASATDGLAIESQPGQLVVLGTGWATALAEEAALKCREAAGMWAESYATGEYRHGPIGAAGPRSLVWAMTELTEVQREAIEATGARVHQGTDDPQVELVKLQSHALAWATASGRNADLPAHLSRAVVVL